MSHVKKDNLLQSQLGINQGRQEGDMAISVQCIS